MRTIKTYSKGAPFYNAFHGTWRKQTFFSWPDTLKKNLKNPLLFNKEACVETTCRHNSNIPTAILRFSRQTPGHILSNRLPNLFNANELPHADPPINGWNLECCYLG